MPDSTGPLPDAVPGVLKTEDAPQASLWKDAFHRMVRRVDVLIAALLILVAVAMALFPTLFTDADPRSCSGRLAKQRPDTWFTGDHPLAPTRSAATSPPTSSTAPGRPCSWPSGSSSSASSSGS